MHRTTTALMAAALITAGAGQAQAFCGFYAGSAGSELTNRATMVVLMRDGTRTVLSMRNHYEGPTEGFAMIVPVPTVLSEDDVNTLDAEVFDRVDTLAAPRLVEYWEQDPCGIPDHYAEEMEMVPMSAPTSIDSESDDSYGPTTVTIEAEFAVAEYDIVILGAEDSLGLERWLHQNGYAVPVGAAEVLRPYVEQGTKFFVARVDPERITAWRGEHALLSPLRVQYESEQLNLPVRLGLMNADGAQDLIVHVLAREQRYEAANYENVTIPTNLRVSDAALDSFGVFYNSLVDRVVERHPNAVITEYAWGASGCDPCPGPVLDTNDLVTLGLDIMGGDPMGFVLSRMHYRYTADTLGDDIVFRAADPIYGGRGSPSPEATFAEGAHEAGSNNFQARYAVLHDWEGEVSCESPQHGRWGGPPGGGDPPARAARDLAFVDARASLDDYLTGPSDLPVVTSHADDVRPNLIGSRISGGGCGCGSPGRYTTTATIGLPFFLIPLMRRRRR